MKNFKFNSMNKKIISLLCAIGVCMSVFAVAPESSVEVKAAPNPYAGSYNITASVNYAISWTKHPKNQDLDINKEYWEISKWSKDKGHCASFVSECLTAGGIYIPRAYRYLDGTAYKYKNTMWTVAYDQYRYLTHDRGYYSETANNNNIHVGDVVYYDWDDDYSYFVDHAAICIGLDSKNIPVIAEHSSDQIRVWNETRSSKIKKAYVVHITDTMGLVDVTNEYRWKSINIKSLNNAKYVSSDTDNPNASSTIAIANRSSVGSWEKFYVVDNDYVNTAYTNIDKTLTQTTKAVSIRTYTNKYLSTDISNNSVPIKNTGNNSSWESFRILRAGNNEYILSMINGHFVKVCNDNKLRAYGETGLFWNSVAFSQGAFDVNVNTAHVIVKTQISFNGVSGPGNVIKGNRASIYGTITSTKTNISTITAIVTRRTDSKQMFNPQTVTVNSMSYKLQLSALDYKLPFGSLNVGNYRITYIVRCTDGTTASKIVDFNIISNQSSVKTYTIRSSSGAKIRAGAGTSNSVTGGLACGSVVYYDSIKSANGYTWYHITKVEAKSGSWGSYIGKWVAGV